ncbi:MAG: ATP-binding protein [Candidatus Aminicenantes bacterium]|nr:ATP-binding protein [Candidatus Aminicenantes bacterium]
MKSPFQFGKVVVGDAFTNRKDEIKRLKSNIENNVHTMLISPRRWGKSSLVKQTAAKLAGNKKLRFCFIDLFKIRNEEDFYANYANTVIKSISSKHEEWIALAKSFLSRITPRISFGADPLNDFEINLDMKRLTENYEEILDLPEKIAAKKNINIIVCIDEFQNLGNFNEPTLFQKRLRAVWQHHQKVSYILYGSKRHMLMHLFENKSMPFFKFGDVVYLDKIAKNHLTTYIMGAFFKTGKEIEKEQAEKIADTVKCHPYYTQQLAHLTWINTDESVTGEILEQAVNELLNQNALLYQREVETLTNIQIKFLKAVAAGEEQLSSTQVIRKYELHTSANISRAKKALEKKEIVDTLNGKVKFIDPVFELWFNRYYA